MAAITQAVKASGVIVRVEPEDFLRILQRQEEPLVVQATGGFFEQPIQPFRMKQILDDTSHHHRHGTGFDKLFKRTAQ